MSKSKKIVTRSVDAYPPLSKWLADHDAWVAWSHDGDEMSPSLQGWRVGPGIVIVVLHPDISGAIGGWDLATTLHTNSIAETLHDANVRLGCPTTTDPRKAG